jgi:hypothetical protein
MEKVFFSKNNFNILYNIIGDNIFKKYNYDLGQDSNFESDLMNCLKLTYKDRLNFNIPSNLENIQYSNELSKRVLDRVLRNIQNKMENKPVVNKIDDINNSLSKRSLNLNESYSNKISKRPIPSVVNNSQDMNYKYEELQNKRSSDNENFQNKTLQYQDPNNISQYQSYDQSQNENVNNNYATYQGLSKSQNINPNPIQTVIGNKNEVNEHFERLQSSRNNEIDKKPSSNIDFRIKTPENTKNVTELFKQAQNSRNNEFTNNEYNDPRNLQNNQPVAQMSSQIPQQFANNSNAPNQMSSQIPQQFANNSNAPNQMSSQINENFVGNKTIENNVSDNNSGFLPGVGENDNSGLDSQFSSLFNTNNEVTNLTKKFENQSLQDRLAEFQKNREIDLKIEPKDTTLNNKLQNTDNKLDNKLSHNISYSIKEVDRENEKKNEKPINNITSSSEIGINKNIEKDISLNKFFDLPISNLSKNDQDNTIHKTYNLIVNSIDRKWEGVILDDNTTIYESSNSSRYNYTVNFNPSYNTFVDIPVYENNQYIALDYTKEKDRKKIIQDIRSENTAGFFYKGRNYNLYDPLAPRGEQLDTETKVIKGVNSGININKSFKNVISVTLKRLIMPSHDQFINLKYSMLKDKNKKIINIPQYIPLGTKREPYLLLHVDELSSNIVSTSKIGKSIFCKAHFDKEYKFNTINKSKEIYNSIINNTHSLHAVDNYNLENKGDYEDLNDCRGWVYYKNDDHDFTEFYPAPLSELNKLSIQILKSNGEIYSEEKDNLRVTKILCLKPGANNMMNRSQDYIGDACIIITLNKYVSSKYFRLGDKIIVKCLNFNADASNQLKEPLKKYLEEGACVIGIKDEKGNLSGEYSKDLNINQIIVKYQITGTDSSGNNLYFDSTNNNDNNMSIINNLTNIMLTTVNNQKCNGFILNTNLQHSIVLEVKVKVKDALTFNPDMV